MRQAAVVDLFLLDWHTLNFGQTDRLIMFSANIGLRFLTGLTYRAETATLNMRTSS